MSVTIHESRIMPSYAQDTNDLSSFNFAQTTPPPAIPTRTPSDRTLPKDALANGTANKMNGKLVNGNGGPHSLPNGRPAKPASMDKRTSQDDAASSRSRTSKLDTEGSRMSQENRGRSSEQPNRDDGYFASIHGSQVEERWCGSTKVQLGQLNSYEATKEASKDFGHQPTSTSQTSPAPTAQAQSIEPPSNLQIPGQPHRVSSPPAFNHNSSNPAQHPYRLQQRHTLEVPKPSTARPQNNTDDVVTASGRFSPTHGGRRRGSMSLVRRTTRSINSDMHLDEVPQDEDAARWAEHIRQKRASKRKRKEDEDEDRVVVGTKVDQNHVNWVTAYNMLTGIRFTVSRTNAKMDRELTDADFDAKHKFSFDITGNELTPSAKYDFKFKDYAPWVFRHLRTNFGLDPADYLVSLTSKYILSELGSPGKSGSFFYFSRDYKYIIKTIHHAEHKFLRKILKDYYNHVTENPNTLLSQFYGLHRVKIPYGRKIHFVVMNNLFPPHRDIHHTFDLKGSTIGRDFKEEELANNPRATLKDLNWLRRDLHLEFGPTKREVFIEQMQKDVKLLQRLHIMDYSMLIGIHDLGKGNEENLRDKTLQVFSPGGEEPDAGPNMLMRTPSKLENARKARELRQMVKTQKPVPMDQTLNKMPDEMHDPKRSMYFYADDGGFRATHENDAPGEEIYYLGIIDCLTHYSLIKRMEHFIKGLANTESQISAIPPERYGDRFLKFISGNTKTREEVEREKQEGISAHISNDAVVPGLSRSSTERVMHKAEVQADRSRQRGRSEDDVPDREMKVLRSPSAERGEIGTTLPVVEEVGESSSVGGRSNRSGSGDNNAQSALPDFPAPPPPQPPQKDSSYTQRTPSTTSRHRDQSHGRPPPTPPKESHPTNTDHRPATPPKDESYLNNRHSGPPTPPKESRGRAPATNKELPRTPLDLETTIRVTN